MNTVTDFCFLLTLRMRAEPSIMRVAIAAGNEEVARVHELACAGLVDGFVAVFPDEQEQPRAIETFIRHAAPPGLSQRVERCISEVARAMRCSVMMNVRAGGFA